jgi:NAD(P)H dehydrogenase (quinone)
MLIVTGASGQLGQRIVDHLLRHVPARSIGVSVRDPHKLAHLAELGVRVRPGDYDDPESLCQAWEGAERVLLVSSNAAATGSDPLKQHATAIEVTKHLAVDRVFYTSQISCAAESHFPPARHHAATEKMLSESGLAWTALRHGFYAGSGVSMNARGFEGRALVAPLDGKVSWTTHDDLAAADAALLSSDAVIDGATPPLTGSEALDLSDLALLAGQIIGTPVSRTVITDEEMRNTVQQAGVPQAVIDMMMGYFLAARAGEFSRVDPTLANLIGRGPQKMRAFMAERLG